MSYTRLQPNSQKQPVTWTRDCEISLFLSKITDLIAAGLVVLDVAGELVEDDPDDEEDGDAGPASDEEPGHVGLSRTGGVLLPRRDGLHRPDHDHDQEDGEAQEVEDPHPAELALLSVGEEAAAPLQTPGAPLARLFTRHCHLALFLVHSENFTHLNRQSPY